MSVPTEPRGFPLVPPPPSLDVRGTLADVAHQLAAAVAAERRVSYEASTRALTVTETGGLRAGVYPARAFEEGGLRALLTYYTAAFPRFTSTALLLDAPTVARVFERQRDSYAAELPPYVRVRERGAVVSAVWTIAPTSYPEYDVDHVAADLCRALGEGAQLVSAHLRYDATTSDLDLTCSFPTAPRVVSTFADVLTMFWRPGLRVRASDNYASGGLSVRAVAVEAGINGTDGAGVVDIGDALPAKRRKRSGNQRTDDRLTQGPTSPPGTIDRSEDFAAACAAVPALFAAWCAAPTR